MNSKSGRRIFFLLVLLDSRRMGTHYKNLFLNYMVHPNFLFFDWQKLNLIKKQIALKFIVLILITNHLYPCKNLYIKLHTFYSTDDSDSGSGTIRSTFWKPSPPTWSTGSSGFSATGYLAYPLLQHTQCTSCMPHEVMHAWYISRPKMIIMATKKWMSVPLTPLHIHFHYMPE